MNDGVSPTGTRRAQSRLRHIATPGIEINKLFRLVRDDTNLHKL